MSPMKEAERETLLLSHKSLLINTYIITSGQSPGTGTYSKEGTNALLPEDKCITYWLTHQVARDTMLMG